MSYPRDLDDYVQDELEVELRRRWEKRSKGLCDYCGRPFNTEPTCRYLGRHKGSHYTINYQYRVTITGKRLTLQVANVDQRLTADEANDLATKLKQAAALCRTLEDSL